MGSYTTYKHIYKPAYGEYGATNLASFDAAIDQLDAKLACQFVVGDHFCPAKPEQVIIV